MAILPWPDDVPPPSSYQFGLIANTQSSAPSPWTGSVQTLEMPGAKWAATLTWTELDEDEWRSLASFVAELSGQAGRFYWTPPAWQRRATRPPLPTGVVVSQDSYGRRIITGGWEMAGGPTWSFMKGDLLGWTDSSGRPVIHMAVERTAPGSDGYNAMRIAPAIRRTVRAGTPVTLTPTGVFRLTKDNNFHEFAGSTVRSSITLAIEEAIFG